MRELSSCSIIYFFFSKFCVKGHVEQYVFKLLPNRAGFSERFQSKIRGSYINIFAISAVNLLFKYISILAVLENDYLEIWYSIFCISGSIFCSPFCHSTQLYKDLSVFPDVLVQRFSANNKQCTLLCLSAYFCW